MHDEIDEGSGKKNKQAKNEMLEHRVKNASYNRVKVSSKATNANDENGKKNVERERKRDKKVYQWTKGSDETKLKFSRNLRNKWKRIAWERTVNA